ncbi:hypothetical protein Fcan01_08437 [Folsomia candida]|uniref:C2H2-type domain-containing protein n=1 Tax=Folsomia candida TaxID=158441 RepID=A0A226EHZ8_FOLCA|nr:hypothetical protein Fcan01_08437 [Folsomia candida]
MGKKTVSIKTTTKSGGHSTVKKPTTTKLAIKMKKILPQSKVKGKTIVKKLTATIASPTKKLQKAKTKKPSASASTPPTFSKPKSHKKKQPQQTGKSLSSTSIKSTSTNNNSRSILPSPGCKINPHQQSVSSNSSLRGSTRTNINGNLSHPVRKKPNSDTNPAGSGISKPTSDKSLLNVRHDVHIHGFSCLSNTVQKATPRVKNLLLNECDFIMECRFCRNLFRSLPNFIQHKFSFCKNLFHPAAESGCSQFIGNSSKPSRDIDLQYYFVPSPATTKIMPSSPNEKTLTNGSSATVECSNNMTMEYNTTSSSVAAAGHDDNEATSVQIGDTETRSAASLYKNIEQLNEERETGGNGEFGAETVKLALRPVPGRSDSVMFQNKIEADRSVSQRKMIEKNITNQFTDICDICKTVFNTEKALRQHRRDAPDCVKQSSSKYSSAIDTGNSINDAIELEHNGSSTKRKSFPFRKTLDNPSNCPQGLSFTEDVQFPCYICSRVYQSQQDYYDHFVVERCGRVKSIADRPPRIGIEAQHYYKKISKPREPFNTTKPTEFDNIEHMLTKEDTVTDSAVDVNCNIPANSSNIESKLMYPLSADSTSNQLNGIRKQDTASNNTTKSTCNASLNLQNNDACTNNDHTYVSNIQTVSSLEEFEGNQDQETVSDMTDSGVSSGSANGTSDDQFEVDGQVVESSSSMDADYLLTVGASPTVLNSCSSTNRPSKRKSLNMIDDRVLVPKNKNLKPGNLEAVQMLKRVSIRNLRKSKTLI